MSEKIIFLFSKNHIFKKIKAPINNTNFQSTKGTEETKTSPQQVRKKVNKQAKKMFTIN